MIKVAIAEDHQSLIDGITLLLEYEDDIRIVGSANDGEEIWEVIETKIPDVVIVDIRMPKVDGIALTKRIKEEFPKIRVLAFTMFDQPDAVERMVEAGVDGYVLKNSPLQNILLAIRSLYRGERFFECEPSENNSSTLDNKNNPLTKRQTEILQLIAQGKTSREIAEQLFIGIQTVETHRKNMIQILNLHGKNELLRYALERKYEF
ncbi:two component transcriptional regulator, LuxR family [Flavobacteriaceae bacterium MAR_2010_188]|nr:two component transcriptional regulator, LuxR family [Flavobacteriaceae bacterium MAR_2010_188]